MTSSALGGHSGAERERALERFQVLQPFLEEGVPSWRVWHATGA